MKRRTRALVLISILALLAALFPAIVLAQDTSGGEDGLLLRINGPVTIGSQDVVENVIVIGDNVTVDGTITGSLIVINGDAIVAGEVGQDVAVVRGTLDLASSAVVGDVSVIRGEFVRDAGATVSGTITEGDFRVSVWEWSVFWAFVWAGVTLVVLTAGVIFAGIGGRQLKQAGDTIVTAPAGTALSVIVAWFVLPVLMFMALFTIVGIPLGVGYFLFVLPVFWFLGYLVAGAQIGRLVLRSHAEDAHPYLPVLLGLIILQFAGIIPVFGGIFGFLAGVAGSGALIAVAWHAWRGPGETATTVHAPITTPEPVH